MRHYDLGLLKYYEQRRHKQVVVSVWDIKSAHSLNTGRGL